MTSYLFTPAQSASEETNRNTFEAMITQAVGQGHLTTSQLAALWRTVNDSRALGVSINVQKDTQSKDYTVSIGGIYHAFKKDDDDKNAIGATKTTKTGVDVGVYVLPIATFSSTGGKSSFAVGASVIGAVSKDLSESTTLDLNATASGTTANPLTDNSTVLSPSGSFAVTATLTFKPGSGVQVPISGAATWTSGYGQSSPNSTTPSGSTTSSKRFDLAIGIGKSGVLGIPFVGASAQISNESILPRSLRPAL